MRSPRRKPVRIALFVFVVLGAIPMLALRVDPREYHGGRSHDAIARSARNASSIAVLFGELRTSMSDILFVKTQVYLHGGVAYVPHHEAQQLSVEKMVGQEDAHHAATGVHAGCCPHHLAGPCDHDDDSHHCHFGEQTVIPPPSRDYRGFIGRLHRQVKPWQDPSLPHVHTDGTELLPWFRIMTITDPNYIMGYSLGSWWVSQHDREMALDFLAEGIRKNPDAFQLRMGRGFIQTRAFRANRDDMELLEHIRSDFRDAVRLGIAQRPDPANGPPEEQPGWSLFQEQDLWSACQMLVILEREFGDPQMARELAAKYLGIFPDNKVLANILQSE